MDKTVKKQDRIFTKDYILIMVAALGGTLANNFFLAVNPLYIEKLGGLQVQTGMMTAAFAVAALISRPISGMISDKYGRIRLIIPCALIFSASNASYGIIDTIPLLVVTRVVSGASFGMLSTCAGAAAADVLPKHRLAEGIGYYGLCNTAAVAIAPGIALHVVRGNEIRDFRTLFFMTAGMCVACAIGSFGISYERKRRALALQGGGQQDTEPSPVLQDTEPSPVLPDSGEKLPRTLFGFEFAVFAPMIIVVLSYGGQAGLIAFMEPFARWRGISNPGLYFTVYAVGVFVSRVLFGRVADKKGFDVILVPALAALTVCLLILPYVGTLFALLALAFPIGIAVGSIQSMINAMTFKRCSPARRGTASGAYSASIDIGFAVCAPLLGAIADFSNYGHMYRAGAVSVFAALLFYIFVCSDRRFNARRLKRHS